MSTRTIMCQVQNEYVKGAGVPVGAAGSHNDVVLEITFSELWEGLTKKITWLDANGENPTLTILTTNMLKTGETLVYLVPIPAEPKALAGDMTMTVKGVAVSGTIETRATLSTSCTFKVLPSDYDSSADASTDINATQAAQLQAEIDTIIQTISNAEVSATAAEASKVEAAASASVAASAKEAAESAQIAAETAKDTAISSKTDAVTAKTAAVLAQTAAETAKTQSQASEINALSSASSASVSEHNAQVWAVGGTLETGGDSLDPLPLQDGAQQYAQQALAAKTAAQTAKTAAEAAQAGAQEAIGAAESFALSAQTAQAGAETAKAGAEEALTGAESAHTASVTAKTDAVAAKTQAETANTAAQDAKTAAETAKIAAQSAQAGAETAQGAAESAVVEAQMAKTAAVTAKTDAVAAKTQAETARTAAQGAQAGAEAAKLSVEGIENLAESWAVGGTGTRESEDTNNAKYWSVQAQNAAAGGVTSFNGRAGIVTPESGDYTAAQVGADPEGSAADVQSALDTHTGNSSNPHGVTKAQIGLGSVPNVTTDNQAPTYTVAGTLASLTSGEVLSTAFGKIAKAVSGLISHLADVGNPHSVTSSQVGLGNVPNVTTNSQTPTYTVAGTLAALTSGELLSTAFGKISKAVSSLISHLADTANPHGVTKTQVGLANVDNTSDADKPISSAAQTALNGKAALSHTHTPSNIVPDSFNMPFGGKVLANATAQETLGDMQIRNISAGTTDLTAGTSTLATGQIYLVYEE